MRPDPFKLKASKQHAAKQRAKGAPATSSARGRPSRGRGRHSNLPTNSWRYNQDDDGDDALTDMERATQALLSDLKSADKDFSLDAQFHLNAEWSQSVATKQPLNQIDDGDVLGFLDLDLKHLGRVLSLELVDHDEDMDRPLWMDLSGQDEPIEVPVCVRKDAAVGNVGDVGRDDAIPENFPENPPSPIQPDIAALNLDNDFTGTRTAVSNTQPQSVQQMEDWLDDLLDD
jgi:hypothetical protein